MKTGVVLEVKDGRAVILKNGGEFVTVRAKKDWKKGDVVPVGGEKTAHRFLRAAASCAVLFTSAFLGYGVYYSEAAVVSIDVNPSIEIKANMLDRVIDVTAYNDEGGQILREESLKNRKLEDALADLLSDGLSSYMAGDALVTVTVQSDSRRREDELLEQLRSVASQETKSAGASAGIEVYAVDRSMVEEAHSHNVTAGKYAALLELQKVMPQMEMEEYAHCDIGEIKKEIDRCSSRHRKGEGSALNGGETDDGGESPENREKGGCQSSWDGDGENGDGSDHGCHYGCGR